MKLLFVIPHYYHAIKGRYGSLRDQPASRKRGLSLSIAAIHQLFGRQQYAIHIAKLQAQPIGKTETHDVKVVLCTTQGRHLLRQLDLSPSLYEHRSTDAFPPLLGFECQKVFREEFGKFDYYVYLEDDLILNDPWTFKKLRWFSKQYKNDCLLQANRYEVSSTGSAHKVYIDGDLNPRVCAKFQNKKRCPALMANVMGTSVQFKKASNPHAGSYFLNRFQMEHWLKQPYYLDHDVRFIGPLESAASLGIMRAFKLYKPSLQNMSFFEILHYGTSFHCLLGKSIPLVSKVSVRCKNNAFFVDIHSDE